MMDAHAKILEELNAAGIVHKVHYHEKLHIPIKTPADFALALNYPAERILKTLFLSSNQKDEYFLAVCSVNAKVNFKALGLIFGTGKMEVASKEVLHQKLAYSPNGVSPIGIHQYPIAADNSVLDHETVLVGGGVPGIEIEISPADLLKITLCKTGNFVQ